MVANVRSYEYWPVVRESGVITQHFSSIVIFVCLFLQVYDDVLSINHLIWIGSVLSFFGYVYWDRTVNYGSFQQIRVRTLKGTLLFVTTLLGLSPILKTLTQDTSDDTIWALTLCLFGVNLLFHDYGSHNTPNIK